MSNIRLKLDLILCGVEILKLKANDHDWQCYVPDDVKEQLEHALIEIDEELKGLKADGNHESEGDL